MLLNNLKKYAIQEDKTKVNDILETKGEEQNCQLMCCRQSCVPLPSRTCNECGKHEISSIETDFEAKF